MAIEYVLLFVHPPPPLESTSELLVHARVFDEPARTWTADTWGFVPSHRVAFRLDSFALDAATDQLVDLVTQILVTNDREALLLFNHDRPVLWRRAGQVQVSRDSSLARSDRLARLAGCTVADLGGPR